MQNGMTDPNNVGAGAHHYMHIMGIVALGLMWLRMAEAAQKALNEGRGDTAFLEAKRVTARHFAERFIPDAGALRRKLAAASAALVALTPEQLFATSWSGHATIVESMRGLGDERGRHNPHRHAGTHKMGG